MNDNRLLGADAGRLVSPVARRKVHGIGTRRLSGAIRMAAWAEPVGLKTISSIWPMEFPERSTAGDFSSFAMTGVDTRSAVPAAAVEIVLVAEPDGCCCADASDAVAAMPQAHSMEPSLFLVIDMPLRPVCFT